MKLYISIGLLFSFFISSTSLYAQSVTNLKIDTGQYLSDVQAAHTLRSQRRVTEEDFIEMSNDKNTIILDARSANKYQQMHIVGSKNLPFTDFTVDALKSTIPSTDTRILIYCNNNVANSPVAFADKAPAASLNLATYPSLYTYGYRNVFELGPVIDPAKSKIKFEGSLVEAVQK